MIEIPSVEFYLVGGSVRDMLLGRKSKDRDYVVITDLTFDELSAAMLQAGATIFVSKPEFLTLRVRYAGEVFDVAYLRVDGDYRDGRRPSGVTPAQSLEQDAKRRDFTINAMYLDARGEIIDFFGGQRDLEMKTIRAVGEPRERFAEDYLRILRAVRFAATLGFQIEPATYRAMSLQAQGLETVSADRMREELNRALLADPRATLWMLQDLPIKPRGFFGLMAAKGLTFEVTLRERSGTQ
jgi:tRNA nucleotidyltransferase/poly(A) polymerase